MLLWGGLFGLGIWLIVDLLFIYKVNSIIDMVRLCGVGTIVFLCTISVKPLAEFAAVKDFKREH